MEKGNKMYSLEIVDKATSAVAKGFSLGHESFKEAVEELPEEIQAMVIASVLAGHVSIHAKMKALLSKASDVEKKIKEMKNPTKEDVDRLFKEAFEKMAEK